MHTHLALNSNAAAMANAVALVGSGMELHQGSNGPSPSRDRPKLLILRKQLLHAVESNDSEDSLLTEIGRLMRGSLGVDTVIYLRSGAGDSATPQLNILAGPSEGLERELRESAAECGRRAWDTRSAQVDPIPGSLQQAAMAAPILIPNHSSAALVVLGSVMGQPVDTLVAALELAAVHVEMWHIRHNLAQARSEAGNTAALIELVGRMQSSAGLTHACHTLVDDLHRFLGCKQVVLGLCEREAGPCRVSTISGMREIDARSGRVRAMEATLDESIARGSLSIWPPPGSSSRHAMLAHKNLADATSAHSVVSSPVRDQRGIVCGAWIFLADDSLPRQEQKMSFIEAAQRHVGTCLQMLRRAERGRLDRCMAAALALPRRRLGRLGLAAIAVLAGLMLVPVPHKVKCDCELQPVTRRFVAAPFGGILQRSLVEPGDIVSGQQLLAKIDGREIRWEIAGVSADLNRLAKQRDVHLAVDEFADAQLAQYELTRLQHKARLLEHRSENLDIRSPIDGRVIAGEWQKAEGVPLTVGETLFEIAPLDRMIVEIAIPEEDISYVRTGLPVDVALDAFPGKGYSGVLARIHPRSEIKERKHVFIGEINLENSDGVLRPGMAGRVEIVGASRCLGWILFHKPWEKLVFWRGW